MSKKTAISKNHKRHGHNSGIKADIKGSARDFRKAAGKKDAALAEEKLGEIIPKLDRAVRKGIIKKNAAARRKSKITKTVNSLKAG